MLTVKSGRFIQNNVVIMEDIECGFKSGEFWGIIGQNGIGKSTLLDALSGLSNQYQGSICIDQTPVHTLDPVTRARKISYLLQEQEPSLAFKVSEAVAMGRFPWLTSKTEDKQITEDILSLCRINHLKDRNILQLSGGERRKVEIATCLAQQADYLLLDEPLNHLDLVYKNHIMQVFKQYSQEHAVVMVCHDIEVVKNYCSHVLMVLGKDCYIAGTSATILTKQNLQRLFNDSSQLN